MKQKGLQIKVIFTSFVLLVLVKMFIIDLIYAQNNYKSLTNDNSSYNNYLLEYSRTPISIKISRIINIGIDKYNRGMYKEAIEIFEQVFKIEPKNLSAIYWIRKCKEKDDFDKNYKIKQELFKKFNALMPKLDTSEEKIETWEEAMYKRLAKLSSKRKEIKSKRIPKKPTKEEIDKAIKDAESGEPKSLYNLAMLYWAMGDKVQALKNYEEAVEQDPEIAALDDYGLLARLHVDVTNSINSNTATASTYLEAGKLARLQGNLEEMIKYLVKAVTIDDNLKDEARKYFEYLVFSNKTEMFLKLPELYSFRIAYAYDDESKEDRIFLKLAFKPSVPANICPLDLNIDWTAIKKVEIVGKDVLYTIVDPNVKELTRLWLVVSDKGEESSIYYGKLIIHLEEEKLSTLELSNPNETQGLADNWAIIVASKDSFGEGFLEANYLKTIENFEIRYYSLASRDMSVTLPLKSFRSKLPQNINVLELLDEPNLSQDVATTTSQAIDNNK